MQIKYLDLQAQYQAIKGEIDQAIQKVLNKSAYVLGTAVDQFETAFADYCETKFCSGVNSGTSALLLALKALDVGPGDEVITAANTFVATASAIVHSGARPVLVDVDPNTRNLDPNLLSLAISRKTRVIIPVHLYGRPADMDPILQTAQNHDLAVLEDCSQAHGARYRGRRVGSMGRIGAFSFYPAKNLGAFGEAGAVTTDDPGLNRLVRMLRDHGSERKYYHDLVGYNARLDGIQGAVLGVKLNHLDRWNAERNRVACIYHELLKDAQVRLPGVDEDHQQVFHLYVIETESRDELQSYLTEHEIPTQIHYPVPIHLLKAFDYLGHPPGDFPVAEKLAREVLSLPIYPEMTNEQVQYVADRIRAFFEKR